MASQEVAMNVDSLENQALADVNEDDLINKKESIESECSDEFNTRIEILVELDKNFLRPFKLSDCYATDRPGMQLEILPKIIFDTLEEDVEEDAINLPKPIFRQTIECGTQASVKYRSSKAQTDRRRLVNSWCQYEPRLFSEEEKNDHFIEESFNLFLSSAEDRVINSLTQNRIADIFFWDLSSLSNDGTVSKEIETSLKISGSFASPETMQKKRMISSIHWHSLYKDIFVASTITVTSLEERTRDKLRPHADPVLMYIWSAKNQFSPQLVLGCIDDVTILKFNPSIPNLIAGGTLTGQLILWDIKNKLSCNNFEKDSYDTFYNRGFASSEIIMCCASSNIDHLHIHGITHLEWVPPSFEITSRGFIQKNKFNSSFQIVTCSLDGLLHFWDLRLGFPYKANITAPKKYAHLDEVWEPFHTMAVSTKLKIRKSLTCFSFRERFLNEDEENLAMDNESEIPEKDSGAEKEDAYADFYGGCDDGAILCGNFKFVKDDDGKYTAKIPDFYKSPHSGSVSVILNSPFIKDVFFSAGDKTIALWKHEIKEKPIFLRERTTYISSGEWSPTRAALFILGFKDGSIEVWDLLQNIYEPIIIHYMSTSAIKYLSIQAITEMEHIVAVGDSTGVVYTMTLSSNLWCPLENELNRVKEFIDKEVNRIIEKDRSNGTASGIKDTTDEPQQKTGYETAENMDRAYQAFLNLQEQQLKLLNIVQEEISEEMSD